MATNVFTSLMDSFFGGPLTSIDIDGFIPPATTTPKSDLVLLDLSGADPFVPRKVEKDVVAPIGGSTVLDLGGGTMYSNMVRQANVDMLRNCAKYSCWVRAAIDVYRRNLGPAQYEIVPADSTDRLSRLDKRVQREVLDLLKNPNQAAQSYASIKEQMIEDYLVVGHGCVELFIRNDTTPYSMRVLDAGTIGFVKSWDGTDPSMPRYVEFQDKNGSMIKRYLAHEQVLCMVNRPMSNTKLGFSHVEALFRVVQALLNGDEFLMRQVLQPIPDSLVNLGEGVTKQQVDEFRYQIQQVRDKFAIIGGPKSAQVLRLSGTAEEFQILDSAEWYVRQVAAVFGISTAQLKLAVDTSRANTESMMSSDLEAITAELTRIEALETATFINRYSYLGAVNLEFSYPIMHRKDEKSQAEIAKVSTGQPWASMNEARMRTGEKTLEEHEFAFANEPLLNMGKGVPPLPVSVYQEYIDDFRKNIGKTPATPAAGAGDQTGDPAADPSADTTTADAETPPEQQ